MTVTLSERARAVAACETEQDRLYAQAAHVSLQQNMLIDRMHEEMRRLSQEHRDILCKITALQDAEARLMNAGNTS